MANTQRAEVEVSGEGGVRHRFRLGTGAICQLEETLNMDVSSLFDQLQRGKVRLSMVREFVKASSVDQPGMSNEDANDLIDQFGVVPVLDAMTNSILATFNIKGENGNGNPQQPARKKAGRGTSNERPKPAA